MVAEEVHHKEDADADDGEPDDDGRRGRHTDAVVAGGGVGAGDRRGRCIRVGMEARGRWERPWKVDRAQYGL